MFAGLLLCAAAMPVLAEEKSKDEKKLETSSGELDKCAVKPEGQARVVDRIKAEFDVNDARVQGLRDKNMGYGEISIALGLAQSLPGGITDDNVQKIVALRQGPPVMGWGRIAKELGLKLGPLQSKVHKMSANVRKSEKAADKAGKEKDNKPGKMDKPEKPGKMDRPEKPGNSGKR